MNSVGVDKPRGLNTPPGLTRALSEWSTFRVGLTGVGCLHPNPCAAGAVHFPAESLPPAAEIKDFCLGKGATRCLK